MIFDELWRAQRRAKNAEVKLRKSYQHNLQEAKKKGEDEYQATLHNFLWEKDELDEETKRLQTQRWLKRASKVGC